MDLIRNECFCTYNYDLMSVDQSDRGRLLMPDIRGARLKINKYQIAIFMTNIGHMYNLCRGYYIDFMMYSLQPLKCSVFSDRE